MNEEMKEITMNRLKTAIKEQELIPILGAELYDKYIKEENQVGLSEDFYKSLENKLIYIDSNIFMDIKFLDILTNFQKYKLNIIIPKEQYDELYNLKQTSNDLKQKKARDAFKIIESFLDLNILQIEDINEKNTNKNAYADYVFINKISQHIQNKENTVFFTDDADLRIRIKSINKDSLVKLYGYKELSILKENEKNIFENKWQTIIKNKKIELENKKIELENKPMTSGEKVLLAGGIGAGLLVALNGGFNTDNNGWI